MTFGYFLLTNTLESTIEFIFTKGFNTQDHFEKYYGNRLLLYNYLFLRDFEKYGIIKKNLDNLINNLGNFDDDRRLKVIYFDFELITVTDKILQGKYIENDFFSELELKFDTVPKNSDVKYSLFFFMLFLVEFQKLEMLGIVLSFYKAIKNTKVQDELFESFFEAYILKNDLINPNIIRAEEIYKRLFTTENISKMMKVAVIIELIELNMFKFMENNDYFYRFKYYTSILKNISELNNNLFIDVWNKVVSFRQSIMEFNFVESEKFLSDLTTFLFKKNLGYVLEQLDIKHRFLRTFKSKLLPKASENIQKEFVQFEELYDSTFIENYPIFSLEHGTQSKNFSSSDFELYLSETKKFMYEFKLN